MKHLMLAVALVSLAASAYAEQPKRLNLAWSVAPVVAELADAGSTVYALRRPGLAEGNPVMGPVAGKPALLIAGKAALGLGVAYAAHRIGRTRPTAAKVLVGIFVASATVATVSNLRVSR